MLRWHGLGLGILGAAWPALGRERHRERAVRAHGRELALEADGLGRLNGAQGRHYVLHGCTNDERCEHDYGDGRGYKQVAVAALGAATLDRRPASTWHSQGQGEGNGAAEPADPHHQSHVPLYLPVSAQIQERCEREHVCCPGHNDDCQRVEDEAEMPMEAAQRQCRNDTQVNENTRLCKLCECSEGHLRCHLGRLREVVPVVLGQNYAKEEEGHYPTHTKQLR
mmetsp:Transcript_33576/g.106543  ORF Transcript_33576/g.106543 Transcript_33576/m.106543 type:complete len:224 (-) Transcript_33576:873-1544(-)